MKRRVIVAGLGALLFLVSGLVHAAFACSAALHGEAVARATAHPDCRDRSAPPCCRQPTATAALQQKVDRLADPGDTLVMLAAPPWPPAPRLDPSTRRTAVPSPRARASDPRLLLVSLLL